MIPKRARAERRFLLALLVSTVGMWAVASMGNVLSARDPYSFDRSIVLSLRAPADRADPVGPEWVEETARDVTALGSMSVLFLVVFCSAGFLHLRGLRRAALFLLASTTTGAALSQLLKNAFDRPRPDLVPHEATVFTSSFPSAHSFLSAVVFLTLGALLARFQTRRALRVYVLGVAALLTLAVGATRIYLGVHWPSDVIAGWIGGAAWALATWAAALKLQQIGAVEPEPAEAE